MKKILVLHTGGTTFMYANEAGNVHPDTDNPVNHVGANLENIQVTAPDFFNTPSPYITPKHMLKLYQKIKKNADNCDGVVITHGTDILGETAYFLDTMKIPNIPIILTDAMHSSNEPGSDGAYDYLNALRVASHDQAIGKGALVVMSDGIHAAKYITRMRTTNVSTFQTPIHGPLGLIAEHDVLLSRTADSYARFDLQDISGTVPIVKAYVDVGGDGIISFLNPSDTCNVVVEAPGAENAPLRTAQGIVDLVKQDIPVVLVSRCFNGIAEPVYTYEGGGVQLAKAGVMFIRELSAQKAYLKLPVALNTGLKGQALEKHIEGQLIQKNLKH